MASILLVDDKAPLLAIISLVLQREGHSIALAADGGEALKLVADRHFDLIITDLVMPEKEGIETIIALRKNFTAIKLVAMSGGGVSLNGRQMLNVEQKLGASQILEKPFTDEALIAAVNTALSAR